MNGCRKIANVNLLNLNDSIYILHTVLHTYPVLLIRMICLTMEIFFYLLLGLSFNPFTARVNYGVL